MEKEPVESERRKILAKSLPFVLNAVWEAHSVLNPVRLASTAASEFQRLEEDGKRKELEIKSLARDIGNLNLRTDNEGRLSLILTRDQLLEIAGNYLISQFLSEGSFGAHFETSSKPPDYDGMLNLPNKAIFAKIVETEIDQNWIFNEADKAVELNPSEVWIFNYNDQRFDVRFDPIFISEGKILRGRFKLIPATELISFATKGLFSATIDKNADEVENTTRFNLTRVNERKT
ncbi:MAG: hypothetical protein JRN20_03600 [Nitrososphaerota archaeon]|jgi:hypothetical protein|nr:hypothetical protein [Nitrososphaerota archaeon]